MKIIVKNTNSERQSPEVTIDTSTCHYTYDIREALQLALELDGYDKETIKNVFNLQEDVNTEPQPEPELATKECIFEDTTHGFMSAVSYLKQMDEKILTLIKPHEIIQHANRLWEQNIQKAEPAQKQCHFTSDADGYLKALKWVEEIGETEMRKLYQDDPNQFTTKANKITQRIR